MQKVLDRLNHEMREIEEKKFREIRWPGEMECKNDKLKQHILNKRE